MTATTNLKRSVPPVVLLLVPFLTRADDAALKVTGEVKTLLKLILTELKAMPSAKLKAKDADGTTASSEGVLLHPILSCARVPQGEWLQGESLGLCGLVKAADGFVMVKATEASIRKVGV